ncbi:MAG: hypothetical protein ACKV19_14230 [Verrucomicrobiales bacterium]
MWHWAHKPASPGEPTAPPCYHEESAWHLALKLAYHKFEGWEIEAPITLAGQRYRLDAMNRRTGAVREFIHTLSPHYVAKHLALVAAPGLFPLWIFDGAEFASSRRRAFKADGIRDLLKPRAYDLQRIVRGLVWLDGELWGEWKNDIWFPRTGAAAQEVTRRVNAALAEHSPR